MERWVDALATGAVLDEAGMDMLWGEHARLAPDTHYGYGWVVDSNWDARVIQHNGGNFFFFAHVLWWPDDDLLVITWSNGNEAISDLAWKLSRAALTAP